MTDLLMIDPEGALAKTIAEAADRIKEKVSLRILTEGKSLDATETDEIPDLIIASPGSPTAEISHRFADTPVLVLNSGHSSGSSFDIEDSFITVNLEGALDAEKLQTLITHSMAVWPHVRRRRETESEIAQIKAHFEAFADAASEGFALTSRGTLLFVNDRLCEMLGYSREEMVGSNVDRYVHPDWQETVRQHIVSGSNEVYEHLMLTKDGSAVPVRIHGESRDSDFGHFRATTITDLSDETASKRRLVEAEMLLDKTAAPFLWVDMQGHFLYANQLFQELTGKSWDELKSCTFSDIDPAYPPERVVEVLNTAREKGSHSLETTFRATDGQPNPFVIRLHYHELEGKEYVSCVAADVKELRAAELGIRKSEDRMRLALDSARVVLWEWNVDIDEVCGYGDLKSILGIEDDKYTGTYDDVRSFIVEEDRELLKEAIEQSLRFEKEMDVQVRVRHTDGSARWISARGRRVKLEGDTGTHLIGTLADITESKKRDEELYRSEQRFRIVAEGGFDNYFLLGVSDSSKELLVEYASPTAGPGLAGEHIAPGDSSGSDGPLRDLAIISNEIRKAFESQTADEGERNHEDGEGLRRWFRFQAIPFSGGVGVTIRDITERKSTEAELAVHKTQLEELVAHRTIELQESEGRFRSVVENTPDYIVLVDRDGVIQYLNRTETGVPSEDYTGTSIFDFLSPDQCEVVRTSIEKVFKTGIPDSYEVSQSAPDGPVRWFNSRVGPVVQEGKVTAVTIISSDITERLKDEEKILELNRNLERSVRERTSELEAILRATNELTRQISFRPVLDRLVSILVDTLIQAGAAAAWSINESDELATLIAWRGPARSADLNRTTPLDHPTIQKIISEDRASVIESSGSREHGFEEMGLDVEESRFLGVPISLNDKPVAFLAVFGYENQQTISRRDLNLLNSIASQAVIALENERLLDRIRMMSVHLLNAQEKERRRIAQELHDEVGGLLTSLQIYLKMLPVADDATRAGVEEAMELVRTLTNQVRSLSLNLRPSLLDDFGLASAVANHVEKFSARTGIAVKCTCDIPDGQRYSPSVETAMFRIMQEALTNISRHGDAETAQVMIEPQDGVLKMNISDAGTGFDVPKALEESDMGLNGIIERAELLEGCVDITSSPDQGTTISVEIPAEPLPDHVTSILW